MAGCSRAAEAVRYVPPTSRLALQCALELVQEVVVVPGKETKDLVDRDLGRRGDGSTYVMGTAWRYTVMIITPRLMRATTTVVTAIATMTTPWSSTS